VSCDDYLAMLATLPVEELEYPAREHAAGCHNCDRVTRVVAEREQNMLMAFDDLRSSVPAAQTAASALAASGRREIARYYQIGLGIATVATVLYLSMSRILPAPPPSPVVTESFRLQCLSPEQAAEVLRPYTHAIGRLSFRPSSPLGVIEVEGSREMMTAVRSVLDRFDNPAQSRCAVQVIVPKGP
jgi:hypothetical protein